MCARAHACMREDTVIKVVNSSIQSLSLVVILLSLLAGRSSLAVAHFRLILFNTQSPFKKFSLSELMLAMPWLHKWCNQGVSVAHKAP